ncbi:uncharacterized protein LOC127005199 isoform X2 [Eriocheir sinensis]|nr:uncharacterized protein LOC127005199 isoform X2 [Eriocheir sinensis]XP_050729854.1 uncharacterized protein LOC127005199 isoform X2 [Eriocheir sinensis]XP_050729855.1 uncharacterized protein LOC127005199 isoform X2 [Eriocheir sinensis]XP_050729856.1 uncharacterized protein LOC127005199 isoform X2 [Eriocheir sinensis]
MRVTEAAKAMVVVVLAVLLLAAVREAEAFVGLGSGVAGGFVSYMWWIFLGSLGVSLYKKKLLRFEERRRLQLEAADERQQQEELLETLRAEAAMAAAGEGEDAVTVEGEEAVTVEGEDAVMVEREDAVPLLFGEEYGPELEYYGDFLYDADHYDVPFVTQNRLPPFPGNWPDEGNMDTVYDPHPFLRPHRLPRSPHHQPDEGEDGGDTVHEPDHSSIPGSLSRPLSLSSDDQRDEDEEDEALQKVLVNLAAQLDTSGCSLRFLCHLLGKPQDALTQDEELLLRLFVGSHSDAPPGSQCDQEFPRCGLQGKELSALFTFTSGLVAKIL